jgi:plasmid stability protein
MRTTLTLDDDLALLLRERARRSGKSFKEVLNTALRKALQQGNKPEPPLPRFQVQPKACGFRSGVDFEKLNQLYDELSLEDFQEKLAAEPPRR